MKTVSYSYHNKIPDCFESQFKCDLLDVNFQKGWRSLHVAAERGHVNVVNALLQKGEQVDAVTNVSLYISLFIYLVFYIYF